MFEISVRETFPSDSELESDDISMCPQEVRTSSFDLPRAQGGCVFLFLSTRLRNSLQESDVVAVILNSAKLYWNQLHTGLVLTWCERSECEGFTG